MSKNIPIPFVGAGIGFIFGIISPTGLTGGEGFILGFGVTLFALVLQSRWSSVVADELRRLLENDRSKVLSKDEKGFLSDE